MPTLTKKDKQDIVLQIISDYKKALEFQRPYFTNFNEYYKLYRSILDSSMQSYNGRANLFVPMIYSTIETIMPRLVGSKPKVNAIPREANDITNAESVSKLLDYQWDIMGMKIITKNWMKQTLLYGTGIVKLVWEEDKPRADLIDLFDFYIDPFATSIKDADYVIQRLERSLDYLKKSPLYKLPKELVAEVSDNEYKIQRDAIVGVTKPSKNNKLVELWEYWGKYDFGNGEEEAVIVIANRKYIIRIEPNPYSHKKKPFIELHDIQIPHEFWSVGEVEPLKFLQYELNDIRNQRMDNVTLILNRMWIVDKGADIDEEELVSQSGGVIHTGNMNGIKDLQTPDVTASSYNEETFVKDDAKTASGVNDFISGSPGNSKNQSSIGNDTATGIMLLQEAGNARFKYKMDNLEDSLKEFGRQLIALDQQFLETEMMVRVVGEGGMKWVTLNPQDIQGEYDLEVEAGSTQPMNKSVRRAEARELLVTAQPFIQMGVLNPSYFIKHLLETYDLTNINEAFNQQVSMAPGMPTAPGAQGPMGQLGGQAGAVFGGNVGNRPNAPLTKLGTPPKPVEA